jgi:hypothetical protein
MLKKIANTWWKNFLSPSFNNEEPSPYAEAPAAGVYRRNKDVTQDINNYINDHLTGNSMNQLTAFARQAQRTTDRNNYKTVVANAKKLFPGTTVTRNGESSQGKILVDGNYRDKYIFDTHYNNTEIPSVWIPEKHKEQAWQRFQARKKKALDYRRNYSGDPNIVENPIYYKGPYTSNNRLFTKPSIINALQGGGYSLDSNIPVYLNYEDGRAYRASDDLGNRLISMYGLKHDDQTENRIVGSHEFAHDREDGSVGTEEDAHNMTRFNSNAYGGDKGAVIANNINILPSWTSPEFYQYIPGVQEVLQEMDDAAFKINSDPEYSKKAALSSYYNSYPEQLNAIAQYKVGQDIINRPADFEHFKQQSLDKGYIQLPSGSNYSATEPINPYNSLAFHPGLGINDIQTVYKRLYEDAKTQEERDALDNYYRKLFKQVY